MQKENNKHFIHAVGFLDGNSWKTRN